MKLTKVNHKRVKYLENSNDNKNIFGSHFITPCKLTNTDDELNISKSDGDSNQTIKQVLQVQAAAQLTYSQEIIIEAFKNQENWDLKLVKHRQTIMGFLVGMFKDKDNEPMQVDQICEYIEPYYKNLRRKEGGRYTGKLQNCVIAALFTPGGMFKRDCKGFWRMNMELAEEYDNENLGKTVSSFNDKSQVPSQKFKRDGNQKTCNQTDEIDHSFAKQKRDKKSQRELIDRFELTYQKVCDKLEDPYFEIEQSQSVQEYWNKLTDTQKGGYLHAFIVLRPFLKKSLRQQEKVHLGIQLLLKSGIFTRKANGRQRQGPLDGIPIITQEDAGKLIELERTINMMNDKVNNILLSTKEQLDFCSHKVQKQQIPLALS
ncbi:UNKNOWN [Stylonychia lemnae]|uniref:Uncharacterized protein n=1 Tax=Stylonychia lemnae TaxID=5949 RepID=A0A078AWU8_STYLE|nr:UNKNOWN [Stylonychia lemnae]|eukprot:CDW86905.1 UNKNOWN [Stylonychia lemnae]